MLMQHTADVEFKVRIVERRKERKRETITS
jgi:hypothetical protein